MRTAGIILAAGESRRMGRAKAFLPFRGGTFLSILAGAFREFCDSVVVVFGFEGESSVLRAPSGVRAVINPGYRDGMLTSLQAGLRAIENDSADRVLFTLVDHPAVSADTIRGLFSANAPIVIPRCAGKRGHPVLITGEIAAEYLREPANAKVRDVIDRHAGEIVYVDVNDPGIHDDIDDPALYEALLGREAAPV